MAKLTKYQTVDNRKYEERWIYRTSEQTNEKLPAISLVPVVPPDVKEDTDYGDWLADLIADGTMTWKQVVTMLLAHIPIAAGPVAFHSLLVKDRKTFTSADLEPMFAFFPQAKLALGPKADDAGLLMATVEKMYRDSLKNDPKDWGTAYDHVILPKQIV